MKKKKFGEWVEVGVVGVDSGQILIVDPCYLKKFKNDERTGKNDSFSYSGCCNAIVSNKGAGQIFNDKKIPLAVASATGYGDGVYKVYVRYTYGGRVGDLKIHFAD